MSRDALRLADLTGCLPQEAASVLEVSPEWSTAVANMQAVISARRRRYQSEILKVWQSFTADTSVSTMTVTQTMQFINSLGVDLEDPIVLCIAYELQAPEIGKLEQEAFVDGWARLEAGTLEDMKQAVLSLRTRFSESDSTGYFRDVYRYTFQLNLDHNEKTLSFEIAKIYWQLLLQPRYPQIMADWFEFASAYDGNDLEKVSRDTWNMILEFCEYKEVTDPQLQKYDESCAWPLIVDDFVDYLIENKRINK